LRSKERRSSRELQRGNSMRRELAFGGPRGSRCLGTVVLVALFRGGGRKGLRGCLP